MIRWSKPLHWDPDIRLGEEMKTRTGKEVTAFTAQSGETYMYRLEFKHEKVNITLSGILFNQYTRPGNPVTDELAFNNLAAIVRNPPGAPSDDDSDDD